jgi:cytochrome c-type biogenesis protein CcmH
MRLWAPWLAMAAILVVALFIGTVGSSGPQTNEQRVIAIAQTLRCPVCDGESVAESDSDASVQIRQEIARRLDEGQTPDQIRAYLASPDRYGARILLDPSRSGVSSLVWIIPVVALVVAGAVLVLVFRRWRSTATMHATDRDRDLVGHALDEGP